MAPPPSDASEMDAGKLVFSEADCAWWIEMEQRVMDSLVELEPLGFVNGYKPYARGWTDDPAPRARPGVARALVRAREALPSGCNFKILDAHRPWSLQHRCAQRSEARIREAYPQWSEAQVQEHLWRMAPPARVVPRLGSHRYGGAVDVAVVDAEGQELDMGVEAGYVAGPESYLLHYEFHEPADEAGRVFRENRRVLMRAMQAGGFEPYLPEWWHWSHQRDIEATAPARMM